MSVVCFRSFAWLGWHSITRISNACIFIRICIYNLIYVYAYRYVKYIFFYDACRLSTLFLFKCHQWESKPDSKRCVVPPSSCPFTHPTCLLSCERPPPIYSLIFPLSPPPPPLPPLSLFVCLILLLPLLLCLPPPDCAVLRWSKGNSTIRPTPWWTLQRWVWMTKLKGPVRYSVSGLCFSPDFLTSGARKDEFTEDKYYC